MKTKTILITGFDPFNKEEINPSYEAVKLLPDMIEGVRIIKREIPTEFYKSKEVMLSLIKEYKPSVVINVGQAGGRDKISFEKKAFNLIDSNVEDNAGVCIKNTKIREDGETELYSTLPIEELERLLNERGIDVSISFSAGRFVCNYIMYEMLMETRNSNNKYGFIHVPYSKEQVKDKNEKMPYMEICDMVIVLKTTLELLVNTLK